MRRAATADVLGGCNYTYSNGVGPAVLLEGGSSTIFASWKLSAERSGWRRVISDNYFFRVCAIKTFGCQPPALFA